MPQYTDNFLLSYYDFGEALDSQLNVQGEIDRWATVDAQLYGYFKIFGNGVITGWDVTANTDLRLTISPGVGIINSFAAETDFPETIIDLPPNSTFNVYALNSNTTVNNRGINFDITVNVLNNDDSLLLATVTTGGTDIVSIDTTVRKQIGFKEIVEEEIAIHRHNGTSASKIELDDEVQGYLPMARMEDIDASKIIGGVIPENSLPIIDHNKLKNIGTISHVGLDSLVKSIQNDNIGLLGEIAIINQLKSIIYHKYMDSDYDKFQVNELAIIPGVTPESYIDYENTTANIDTTTNCISGLPSFPIDVSGETADNLILSNNLQIITVAYDTDAEFSSAVVKTNVSISDGVKISTDTVFDRIIESWDDGIATQTIPGFTPTLNITNTIKATYDATAAQGSLAAKFSANETSRTMEFVKTFSREQDWSSFDTLVLFVKNYNATHSTISMEIKDADGVVLATYVLLSADEVTIYDNPDTAGYAKKEFDISGFVRGNVASIRLFSDEITSQIEAFYLDTIYLKSSTYLLPQGNIRLRYQSASQVIFNSVEYYGTTPSGTDIRTRVRVANTLADLVNSTYSSVILSGETIALPGTVIEIDITLLSNSNRTLTPTLDSVYLTMLSPSTASGLEIKDSDAWSAGELSNITVNTSEDYISLTSTNVGNMYFISQEQLNEINPDLIPVAGIRGDLMPVSPRQGYNVITPQTVDEYDASATYTAGLYHPKSAYRLVSGNYLIADTGNDRILEIKSDGTFVRGYGSHNTNYSDTLFALSANYNPRLGILFITFSTAFDLTQTNFNAIKITLGTSKYFTLSSDVDKLRTLKGDIIDLTSGTSVVDRTLSIVLSSDKQSSINAYNGNITVQVINDVNLEPLDCFVGDFMYFAQYGISRPIFAKESSDDTIIIGNAAITSDSTTLAPSGTTSIIEFDKNIGELFEGQLIGTTFTYNGILFSDIVLGSMEVITEDVNGVDQRRLLIAGLTKPGTGNLFASSSSSGSNDLGNTDKMKLQNFVGTVLLVDMTSNLIAFRYNSPDGLYPSDIVIDNDGYYVVAESSLSQQAGRIVTLDTNGNIIKLIEGGVYTKINDIRILNDNHLFVST